MIALISHILQHLGKALDDVRKAEYSRLSGKHRRFIKGQKYTLLSNRENLTLEGRRALKTLLAANRRLNTAYCNPENKVLLGFVEGLNNKIRSAGRATVILFAVCAWHRAPST